MYTIFVWLGRSTMDRRPEDEAIEDLAFALMKEFVPRIKDPRDVDNFVKEVMVEENPQLRLTALAVIFNHPWFERLWMHQEVIVSTAATALCQYRSEPFNLIQHVGLAMLKLIGGGEMPDSLPFLCGEYITFRKSLAVGCQRVAVRAFNTSTTTRDNLLPNITS
jgi:hypothetical protein